MGAGAQGPPLKPGILEAYKGIDKTLDKMGEIEPKIKDDILAIKQSFRAAMTKLGVDPKMLETEEKPPAAVPDNKSPQEAAAAPMDNKSPQEVPVPA